MEELPPIDERTLIAAALVVMRLLPVVTLTPLFGGAVTPRRFRVGLGVLFGIALAPGLAVAGIDLPERGLPLVVALLREALSGLTLAVFVRLTVEAVQAGGALIDLGRGASWPAVFDPGTQQQTPPMGALTKSLFLALFATSGGLREFLAAFARSFEALPPGSAAWFGSLGSTAGVIDLVTWCFVTAVRIAAPVLLVMLLVDLALGLLNRFVSQVQVFFLGMVFKGTLGVILVALLLRALSHDVFPELADRLIAAVGGSG